MIFQFYTPASSHEQRNYLLPQYAGKIEKYSVGFDFLHPHGHDRVHDHGDAGPAKRFPLHVHGG